MSLRVLIVEDEMTIAFMMEDMLADLGHAVAGTPMRLAPALEAARTMELDFAILDVNLDGEKSYPVAELLTERGIPFAFATGYGAAGVDPPFREHAVLQKPFRLADLQLVISRAASR